MATLTSAQTAKAVVKILDAHKSEGLGAAERIVQTLGTQATAVLIVALAKHAESELRRVAQGEDS